MLETTYSPLSFDTPTNVVPPTSTVTPATGAPLAASVIEPANDPTAAFPCAAPSRGRSVAAAITTAANAGNFIRSTLNIEQPSCGGEVR